MDRRPAVTGRLLQPESTAAMPSSALPVPAAAPATILLPIRKKKEEGTVSELNDSAGLEERPLRELITQLSRDASELAQQEIALAKQEAREKADELKASLLAVASGALVLQIGFISLAAALVLLLAQPLPAWAAAAAVGAAFCVVGALLLQGGKHHAERIDLTPQKSKQSLKADAQSIKEAAR